MFLPQRMNKILIISTEEYGQKIIEYLHKKGVMQISTAEMGKDAPLEHSREINSLLTKIERIFETFSLIKEEKTKKEQVTSLLNEYLRYKEKETRKFPEFDTFLEERSNEIEKIYDRIENISEKIRKKREKIEYLQSEHALLSEIKFDIDLKYLGRGKFIYIAIGKLKEEIEDDEIEVYKKGEYSLVIVPTDKMNMVQGKISVIKLDKTGTPNENLKRIEKEIKNHEEEIEECEKEIKETKEKKEVPFKAYQEILEIEKERADIPTKFGRTEKTIAITGYVPEKEVKKLSEEVETTTEGYCHLETVENEDPPVTLSNPAPIRPYEMLVNMFGTPKYSEIDPTFIVAPIYILFYAIMFGDFFYGFIQTVIAFFLYKGAGKKSKGMRDFSYILLTCGIATMIAGIAMGSYFGDILDYGGYQLPALVNPINDPMTILKLALILGIVHLNIGITLGMANNIMDKKYKSAILENVSWYFAQIGGGILIGKFFQWFTISDTVNTVGIVCAGIGALMIAYDKKGLSFFEFTGFLGDWLSYARILALALATSGIAMTVNIVAKMVYGFPIMGIILAVIVFIGGQLFNFVLEALGSFVHSLRLHYVEFFSKFYESGGKEFTPFKMERKLTEVVE